MPLRPLDFVVMVRQAHHAQRNILGLPKDQSNDRGEIWLRLYCIMWYPKGK